MVFALGCGSSVVGRSHECDFPLEVTQLPVCTSPNFRFDGSSIAIDRGVKDLLRAGLAVYEVDVDQLRRLAPELILTQTQCEVCAVSFADVERALNKWLDGNVEVVSLAPNALADVWADIERVATALHEPERGHRLRERLEVRVETIAKRVWDGGPERPRVACIEWIEPLMAAGNWVPELVELAGGTSLFGMAGAHSPWMAWEELREADPDMILVMPCGWDMERSRAEVHVLTKMSGWDSLRSVRKGRVFLTEGNQYFNRPGPRLVESLEILVELFHPELFDFGHEGQGWRSF